MLRRNKLWVYGGALGALAAFLVSMQALGMVMPWQAATASEVASKGRVDALSKDVKVLDERVDKVDTRLAGIDSKLDIVIELLKK